jgi:RNA polymerase sigma-70 factor, ECF subfamily
MEEAADDEGELRQRLAAGDHSALAEAYDTYGPQVYGVALSVTRSRPAAEDVTQTVFVWLWEHPLVFDPARGRLSVWLRTLAHRRAVDHVRRERRRRWLPVMAQPSGVATAADEATLRSDTILRVQRVVAALPIALREVVELAYFGGRTYREVAAELGLPEGTTKSRIRIALRRMAAQLRSEGTGP